MQARILTLIGFLLISFQLVSAQPKQDIGDFSIDKVMDAVEKDPGAGSDTALKASNTEKIKPESWGIITFRIVGYLALIIALIIGAFFAMKKIGIKGASAKASAGSMDLLETLTLGTGRTILLVRVMDCVLVLGQTAQNIVLLEKIEGQKALDAIASAKSSSSVMQFREMFGSFLGKTNKAV